jgi:hypothetical protein
MIKRWRVDATHLPILAYPCAGEYSGRLDEPLTPEVYRRLKASAAPGSAERKLMNSLTVSAINAKADSAESTALAGH